MSIEKLIFFFVFFFVFSLMEILLFVKWIIILENSTIFKDLLTFARGYCIIKEREV